MPGRVIPYLTATIQDYQSKWIYYLNAPPVVLTTLASHLHESDTGVIANGRYHPALGMVHGPDTPARTDTALNGTSGRGTGCRFFTKLSGSADSNWRDPIYNNWGILCNDGTPTGSFDLLADHVHGSIETSQVMIWRSPPPYDPTGSPTAENCYMALELASGGLRNYRILMPFSKAVCLQFTSDGGLTWTTVSTLKAFSRQEVSFTAQDYLIFYLLPNYTTGMLTIDCSAGGTMQHTPRDTWTLSNARANWLPALGRFRAYGRNGWSAFTVNGKVHTPVQVARTQSLPYSHPQKAGSWLSANSLTQQADQTETNNVIATGNDFNWQSQIALTSPQDPPEWSDAQLIIPPDWTIGVPGAFVDPTIVRLAVSDFEIEETLDDNRRTFTREGSLVLNNDGDRYLPDARHMALTVFSSMDNGATFNKRCEAIVGIGDEGNVYENVNCLNDLRVRFADRSYQMGNGKDVPIGYELQLDGWAFWSAFRMLCHLAGVHNVHLQRLPDAAAIYVPPGGAATVDYPYGKADPSYTGGPILANGTGDNPLHVYGAAMTPWQVLQLLVQDESLTVAGQNYPYVFGFDIDGYMLCYPYNPGGQLVTVGLTDRNTLAAGAAYPLSAPAWVGMERFSIGYSVGQLRSELTLEGQDWLTNELLVEHRDQSPAIKARLAFPVRLFARQERWGEENYLSTVADGLQTMCSLPVAIAAWSSPHIPNIHAGDRIVFLHPKVGLAPIDFYITSLVHQLHEGPDRHGTTHGTARAIINF